MGTQIKVTKKMCHKDVMESDCGQYITDGVWAFSKAVVRSYPTSNLDLKLPVSKTINLGDNYKPVYLSDDLKRVGSGLAAIWRTENKETEVWINNVLTTVLEVFHLWCIPNEPYAPLVITNSPNPPTKEFASNVVGVVMPIRQSIG